MTGLFQLRATAVTRGWNGYRNKSQHRKLTLVKKILPPLPCRDSTEPATFPDHESGALTTELSPLPIVYYTIAVPTDMCGTVTKTMSVASAPAQCWETTDCSAGKT